MRDTSRRAVGADFIDADAGATELPGWVDAAMVYDVSARGIASYVAGLIRSGDLGHGEALPKVRVLARAFHVSPATVSAAWGLLKKRGLVVGTGKSGIRVTSANGLVRGLEMYATVPGRNDLRLLYPDAALLPALGQALIGAARLPNLDEYYDSAILPGLQAAIEPSWPARTEAFAVANGGADAVWSVLHAHSVPGDRLVLESPTQPQLVTLIRDLGLTLIPVPYERYGPDPRALSEALHTRPVAVLFQPRAHVPTGWSTTPERIAEIATLLHGRHRPLVIEYDDLGALARTDHNSLGAHLPHETVIIRSYEKSYGPDLRLAVIGASGSVVANTHAGIRLTRQWTSRILQAALQWLLEDQGTAELIERARCVYGDRLDTFSHLLQERGVAVSPVDGFCAWVPVLDEAVTASALLHRGVLALRGESSFPVVGTPHLRVATSRMLPDDMVRLADLIAAAAGEFS